MATLPELARTHTRLDVAAIAHLQRLVGAWGVLSDLCFADLLLFSAVTGAPGSFVVLGQVRPTTSQTLHRDDMVGTIVDEQERPLLSVAWLRGQIVEGEIAPPRGERARTQCIPVRWRGRIVGVMTRESAPSVGRRPGELERVYVQTFDRFARMIVDGAFPFAGEDEDTEESPRVGDGALLLDANARIEYASPNAINALHRMGIYSNVDGMRLDELGLDDMAVRGSLETGVPVTAEVERRPDVIVLMRSIPLIGDGRVTGGLVLLRDVTDLRRRDRLLLTKDATIREVHHRVKNNLQMITSLLRLQSRRLPGRESAVALLEAERRIRSIALVHEILSRDAAEQVEFNEIVHALVRVAEDAAFSDERKVRFSVTGDAGELPAEVATPLAVVLNELLMNAAEHAFVGRDSERDVEGHVDISLDNDLENLVVKVRDDGVGLPAGFTIENTDSLGLSIVWRLVTSQLSGSIEMRTEDGTVVELKVPLEVE